VLATGNSPLDDNRILVLNTPESIRLQLRSRVSWPARVGLALVGVIGILILWAVARALLQGGIQNWLGAMLATTTGMVFLIGPYLAARWTRFGTQVVVSPERLIVKRHWTHGGKALDLALDQVRRVEESENGIVMSSNWEEVEAGDGLTSTQRSAVIDFLRQSIEDRVRGGVGTSRMAGAMKASAGSSTPVRPTLEFRYGEGLVRLVLEALVFFGVSALCVYLALHNERGIVYWGVRLSRAVATSVFWAVTGVCLLSTAACLYRFYDRIAHPRRLFVWPDRIALHDDARGAVREILFRDIQEIEVLTVEGKQTVLAISHTGGDLKIDRGKLPRSSDFEQVRDAVSSGFEDHRTANARQTYT
jgi:hypothetical protein